MSKERLEEIKEYFGYWMENDFNREWSLSNETINNLKFLIKQAEEVEKLQSYLEVYENTLRHMDNKCFKVERQNKRYRERIEKLEATNWELIEENKELKEQINQHIRFLAENEELAVAYNNVQKEIYILKNKLESHRNTLKFYADETNYDAQYRLEIMRDSGDRARRELIN